MAARSQGCCSTGCGGRRRFSSRRSHLPCPSPRFDESLDLSAKSIEGPAGLRRIQVHVRYQGSLINGWRVLTIRNHISVNHSFAPRMSSGAAGGSSPSRKPLLPLIDFAAAKNQVSNSYFGITTETC